MGGKGGGGGNEAYYYAMQQQQQKAQQEKDAADLAAEQARLNDIAAAAAAKTPEVAPATPEAPKAEEPAPEASKPVEALGPSVGSGGYVTQPDNTPKGPTGPGSVTDTGATLGGSILNPPKYWTGNVNQYKTAIPSNKKVGNLTNTQT